MGGTRHCCHCDFSILASYAVGGSSLDAGVGGSSLATRMSPMPMSFARQHLVLLGHIFKLSILGLFLDWLGTPSTPVRVSAFARATGA